MMLGQWNIYMEKNESWLPSFTIIKSSWIVELNINSKLIKFLKDKDLYDIVMREDFSIRGKSINHKWKY